MQYEWNARNQITLWGPNGEILDYAIKQWAGVVKDYILPRWELFINELGYALANKIEFNFTAFKTEVFSEIEEPFTFSTQLYEPYPIGISKVTSFYKIHFCSILFNRRYYRDMHISLRKMATSD